MPVEITASGSDDNVLAQVATDGGFPVTVRGSVRNQIEQVAASAAVAVPGQMGDRNAIEALALLLGGVPFVYRLDDDGTLAAQFGGTVLSMVAPEYLTGTAVLAAGGAEHWGLPADLNNSVESFAGQVLAFEIIVSSAPWAANMNGHYSIGGGVAALDSEGALVNFFNVRFDVYSDRTELLIQSPGGVITIPLETLAVDVAEQRLGIYVRQSDGAIGVRTAATDYGYTGATLPAAALLIPWIGNNQASLVSGDVVGQEVSITLVTEAASMTMAYPAGAVDCYAVEV